MFLGKNQTEYNTINFNESIINQLKNMDYEDENIGRYKISRISLSNAIKYIKKITTNEEPLDDEIKGLLICNAAIYRIQDDNGKVEDGFLNENNNVRCNNNVLNGYDDYISNYYISIEQIKYGFSNLIVKYLIDNKIKYHDYANHYNQFLKDNNKRMQIVYTMIDEIPYVLLQKYDTNFYDFPIDIDSYTFYSKIKNIVLNDKHYKYDGENIRISIIILPSPLNITKNHTFQLVKVDDLTTLNTMFRYNKVSEDLCKHNNLCIQTNKLININTLIGINGFISSKGFIYRVGDTDIDKIARTI
jgi:hypothetical protein